MKKTDYILLSAVLLGGLLLLRLRAEPSASHRSASTASACRDALPGSRFKQESNNLCQITHSIETGNLDALTRCFVDWNESNPNELHIWLNHFESSPDSSQLIAAALARGGLHDNAFEFALRLPEPQRSAALKTAFSIHAATAPLEAWTLADGISEKEPLRDLILETGSDAFLPELADLALYHHQSSGRAGGLHSALTRWTLQDPAEAAIWMNQHTVPSEIRDAIASHLVFQCDSENRSAETAISWAESISEPQLRFDAVRAALRELARSEPAKAADVIHRSVVLSTDEKQMLINTLATPVATIDFPTVD